MSTCRASIHTVLSVFLVAVLIGVCGVILFMASEPVADPRHLGKSRSLSRLQKSLPRDGKSAVLPQTTITTPAIFGTTYARLVRKVTGKAELTCVTNGLVIKIESGSCCGFGVFRVQSTHEFARFQASLKAHKHPSLVSLVWLVQPYVASTHELRIYATRTSLSKPFCLGHVVAHRLHAKQKAITSSQSQQHARNTAFQLPSDFQDAKHHRMVSMTKTQANLWKTSLQKAFPESYVISLDCRVRHGNSLRPSLRNVYVLEVNGHMSLPHDWYVAPQAKRAGALLRTTSHFVKHRIMCGLKHLLFQWPWTSVSKALVAYRQWRKQVALETQVKKLEAAYWKR